MYRVKKRSISFKNSKGFSNSKMFESSDLVFDVPTQRADYSEYIRDGGNLRPLPRKEQIAVLDALYRRRNTEMTLIFLIALYTGARIQTVLTLRIKHFTDSGSGKEARVRVGTGTGADTKYGKRYTLYFPDWLYKRIKTYIGSDKAKKRRDRCKLDLLESDNQYVFLSQIGYPMYFAKQDIKSMEDSKIKRLKTLPDGGAVRKFISSYLIPELKMAGHHFDFEFHFLRATYGMNEVEKHDKIKNKDGSHRVDVLLHVMERMGHSDRITTLRYLNYKKKFKDVAKYQDKYEDHIWKLMENCGLPE